MKKRTLIMQYFSLFFLIIFGIRLFSLQLFKYTDYKKAAEKNRHLNIKTSAMRATILDRNGIVLAKSKPIFTIIFSGTNKELKYIAQELEKYGFKNGKITNKTLIFKKLEWDHLSRIFTCTSIPMPDIEMDQIREYPTKESSAHITGYVFNNAENHYIGKTGVEKAYNYHLSGKKGTDTFLINAQRIRLHKKNSIKPEQSQPLILSIDSELQELAYSLLSKKTQGAIIIADLQTGEIIVSTSFPSFNPEDFAKRNNEKIQEYFTNHAKPLINTIFSGFFPIGSAIKPFMLIGMLMKGKTQSHYHCPGVYYLGNHGFKCWSDHGTISLEKILPCSCNYAFYFFSQHLTQDDLANIWQIFGLSELILPELGAKYSNFPSKQNWKTIDTLLMQIGQGSCVTTIGQLARAYARLATGKKINFTILKQNSPKQFEDLPIAKEHLEFVRNALFDTINKPHGTSFGLYKFINACGKTGTAQVRKLKTHEYRKGNAMKAWNERDHSLFCAFAPYDNPRFVGAIILIHGGAGYLSICTLMEVLDATIQKYTKYTTTPNNNPIQTQKQTSQSNTENTTKNNDQT